MTAVSKRLEKSRVFIYLASRLIAINISILPTVLPRSNPIITSKVRRRLTNTQFKTPLRALYVSIRSPRSSVGFSRILAQAISNMFFRHFVRDYISSITSFVATKTVISAASIETWNRSFNMRVRRRGFTDSDSLMRGCLHL